MKKVKIVLNDGSSMQGSIEVDENGIADLLNDKTSFLEFIRPDGKNILLAKGYIAYIIPDNWEENAAKAQIYNII